MTTINFKLKAVLNRIESGELKTACVYHLLDTYYQCVIGKIDEIDDLDDLVDLDDNSPFPAEFFQSVESRSSGIGIALSHLLESGHDIDSADGGFNALMIAVGCGDAPMVRFLIEHGADANTWPEMEEDPPTGNYYLDDIDIHFMDESFANDKDLEYMKALHRTALVLVEDAHLGPYHGHCLTIDDEGNVALKQAETLF